MLTVRLEVAFPADILSRFYPNGRVGGLTLDGHPPGALGEFVTLTVRVQRPARELEVRGQLAWARHRGSRTLKECFGIDFIGGHERLLSFAKAELDAEALRDGPRQMTDLPVRITHAGLTRKEFLVDISPGGAFVRSALPLGIGDPIELHLKAPRTLTGFTLKGVVAWQRQTGDAAGFGVHFVDDDPKGMARLEKLLARISAS